METATQTPVDRLTVGTIFIPTGMKKKVEAIMVEDWHIGYILVGYLGPRGGFDVCRLSKYDTVETFPPVYA